MSHKCTLLQCPRTHSTVSHSITARPSPSHSAQTTQLGGLEKISPTMRQHSVKQMSAQTSRCYILHNKSKTLAVLSLSPSLHLTVESSEIRQPMRRGPRTSSIFSLIQPHAERITTCSSAFRVVSTSGQYPPGLPHAFQAAASPT